MIQLAIVEDEEGYIEQMRAFLHRYEEEKGCRFSIRLFRDGMEILDPYPEDLDIILMDIQMRHLDGMTTAERIREIDPGVILLFITNMEQYAVRGYEVDALDYMVKPIEYYAFSRKMDRALARSHKREKHYITIRMPGSMRKIDVSELQYVESQGHALHFHSRGEEYVMRGIMRETEEALKQHGFYRCNKGCLVNLALVNSVEEGCVVVDGDKIPISRGKRKEFMTALAEYMRDVLT